MYQVGRAGWLLDYSDAANTLDLLRTGTAQGDTINWGNSSSAQCDKAWSSPIEARTQQAQEDRVLAHGRCSRLGRVSAQLW